MEAQLLMRILRSRSFVHGCRFGTVLCALLLWLVFVSNHAGRAEREKTPWQLEGWKYRRPVQVFNTSNMDKTGIIVALTDFPFLTLINDGKLAVDAHDLRLVDETGKAATPLRADFLLNDTGRARLAFFAKDVPKGDRRHFWLYYGNPQATPAPALEAGEDVPLFDFVAATYGAEQGLTPETTADAGAHARWMAPYHLFEAEIGQLAGAASVAKLSGPAATRVSGDAAVAFGDGGQGTIALEVNAENGENACWVRYCPSMVNKAPHGKLTVSVKQGDTPLVEKTVLIHPEVVADAGGGGGGDDPEDMKPAVDDDTKQELERTAYRWLPLRATFAAGKATITITGEKTLAGVDCVLLTKDLKYLPDVRDFQNRVWMRFAVKGPAGGNYFTNVDNQIYYDNHGGHWAPTGDVGFYGLNPVMKPPLEALEGDYLASGEYSNWVLLPMSNYDTWFTQLLFKMPDGMKYSYANTRIDIQFSHRPSVTHLFHLSKNESADSGQVAHVRMPTDLSPEGLKTLETFGEWAERRLALVKDLKLGPPPRLKRVIVGDWAFTGTPDSGIERIENEFGIQDNLGFNMVFGTALPNDLFEKLAKEHGLVDVNTISRLGILERAPGTWKGETVDGWIDKNITQAYKNMAADIKKNTPFAASLTTRFNMEDEIGPLVDAKGIQTSPAMMTHFHAFLQKQGLTPQSFGMETWDDVNPIDDRKMLGQAGPPKKPGDVELPPDDPDQAVKNPGLADEGPKYPPEKSLAAAKLFYYTRRYIDYYTGYLYKFATDVLLKEFPKARNISPNYQAGPMQMAFLGNNNDGDKGMLDIFYLSRSHSFFGLMMEDWVGGNDYGIGKESLGTEIMRSAARLHKDTICALQVGGEDIKHEMFGFLMHGAKDLDSYLYGPLQNIGPAWGDYKESNASVAKFTREIKPFDEAIGDGDFHPRKAAMLVAYTSEVMQQHGLNHCYLRQNTYIALEHSYVPVDVVCEQEVTEDNILKNYDLLFITDPQTPAAVQKKIADWVKNGGHLWAGAGALNWDEFNQPSPILNDVLGVAKRTLVDHPVKAEPNETITADSPLFGGKVVLPVYGETIEAQPTTAKVIGAYADGKPAVLLNQYGKGEAMLVGAAVGSSYFNAHFKTSILNKDWKFESGAEAQKLLNGLTESAKIEKPVVLSTPGIYTAAWDAPQGTLVFLNNATYAAIWDVKERRPAPQITARIRVPGPIKSVLSKNGELKFTQVGNEVTVQLALPDTDILLLK